MSKADLKLFGPRSVPKEAQVINLTNMKPGLIISCNADKKLSFFVNGKRVSQAQYWNSYHNLNRHLDPLIEK